MWRNGAAKEHLEERSGKEIWIGLTGFNFTVGGKW